ncbi:MAG: DUF2264 domain-containing protein [Bacteroidota bacterium]|nr:DUF2264 domain-containing protein [Bacteroidota bacterium]MDP4225239.1 DUF2264 domain-containing protein [Bacteroidota bacterium]MDP4273763.1 DUF2264 domain-containing protein [Bacteroidota bacterium]
MIRRNFLKLAPVAGLAGYSFSMDKHVYSPNNVLKFDTRAYWVSVLTKIADPLLVSLSNEKLKANMPVEAKAGNEADRRSVTHLEAFGRLMDGISPWLELGPDNSSEGLLRSKYISLAQKCLSVATNPSSPDFMNFTKGGQPLVDAAFLAHGLLRGFDQLWQPLDSETKNNIIKALKSTRVIKPGYNNWLLFSAMIEAFLLKIGEAWDPMRVDYAIKKHIMDWYKGDGLYGDGSDFHWDYYNSFVIQPMLLEVIKIMVEKGKESNETYKLVLARAKRYATIQERLISPEGTFPAIGRSLAYRFGAFQLLSQITLMNELPSNITPAQVRSALSLVIHNMIEAPGTFDNNGWLTIGFHGHQPGIGETYISTGSLYLCTAGLLPLGLPPSDPFWTSPAADWTQKKIWNGQDLPNDHAL